MQSWFLLNTISGRKSASYILVDPYLVLLLESFRLVIAWLSWRWQRGQFQSWQMDVGDSRVPIC